MTATSRRRTPVDLTKPTRPTKVVAGGLIWTADEDDTDTGARIGFELAIKHGILSPARDAS